MVPLKPSNAPRTTSEAAAYQVRGEERILQRSSPQPVEHCDWCTKMYGALAGMKADGSVAVLLGQCGQAPSESKPLKPRSHHAVLTY